MYDTYLYAAAAIVVILVLLYLGGFCCTEGFANVEDKARHLSSWLIDNPDAQYIEFIKANPESNIVEYTKLKQNGQRVGALAEALRI